MGGSMDGQVGDAGCRHAGNAPIRVEGVSPYGNGQQQSHWEVVCANEAARCMQQPRSAAAVLQAAAAATAAAAASYCMSQPLIGSSTSAPLNSRI